MKKFGLLSLSIVTILTIFIAPSVSAHVLKTDGNIGAILHINPDDNPISGTPTKYILYFDDYDNQFNLRHCDCKVTIQVNGNTIANQPLTTTNPLESVNTYTFLKPDVYTLLVSGQPKPGFMFQSFSLNYLVRVQGGTIYTQPMPILLWIGIGFMILLILLAAFAMEMDN